MRSQVNLPKTSRLRLSDFLRGANLSRALIERKKAAKYRAESSQVRVLAAKIEFSYGAGQTVNLLALRLQWFESTPAHASPRAKITWIRGGSKPCFDDVHLRVSADVRLEGTRERAERRGLFWIRTDVTTCSLSLPPVCLPRSDTTLPTCVIPETGLADEYEKASRTSGV